MFPILKMCMPMCENIGKTWMPIVKKKVGGIIHELVIKYSRGKKNLKNMLE